MSTSTRVVQRFLEAAAKKEEPQTAECPSCGRTLKLIKGHHGNPDGLPPHKCKGKPKS